MTSRSAWTHNMKHLINEKPFISQKPARRFPQGPPPKVKGLPHPRDRVKFWNIQPGDEVGIFRGNFKPDTRQQRQVFKVHDIDKRRNMLEIEDLPSGNRSLATKATARVHYSNVGLYLGKHSVPVKVEGQILQEARDVFATRLIVTEPKWNPYVGHYTWRRFAASTWPVIAGYEKHQYSKRRRARSPTLGRSTLIEIPWPNQKRWQPSEASQCLDTLISAVENVSWLPTTQGMMDLGRLQLVSFPPNSHHIEDNYLRASLNGALWAKLPGDPPMEVFLIRELANPHSRSKKQARWHARLAGEKDLCVQSLRAEFKGKQRSLAHREAIFRWNARLDGEKTQRSHDAWTRRGGLERQVRNKRQRIKRAASKDRKLREIALPLKARNQFVLRSHEDFNNEQL